MRLIIEIYFIVFFISWSSARTPSVNYQEEDLNPAKSSCNTAEIEYRLTKLEVLTAERGEALKSELQENNRRLQALEWKNSEIVTAIEDLKNEINRLVATAKYDPVSTREEEGDNSEEIKHVEAKLKPFKHRRNSTSIRKNRMIPVGGQGCSMGNENSNDEMEELRHLINVRQTRNDRCESDKPRDCVDLRNKGSKSGVYKIYPEGGNDNGIMVLCEMEVDGGGWAVIQNRYDGSQNFHLGWHDYKHGFGNLGGEFWLGLENLYKITGNEINELLIQLVDHTSSGKYAHYGAFVIGSEMEGYSIKLLSGYEGDAGDSLKYHAGSRFSTKDMDQDTWDEGSCARSHIGGWWYKACEEANLNGKYLNGELPEALIYKGMYWGGFRGPQYSLRKARMMIRPRDKAMNAN